jgi:hypothetical protein
MTKKLISWLIKKYVLDCPQLITNLQCKPNFQRLFLQKLWALLFSKPGMLLPIKVKTKINYETNKQIELECRNLFYFLI